MLSIQEDLDLSRKNDYRPGADRAAAFKIIKAKDMELERLKAVLQRTEDRQRTERGHILHKLFGVYTLVSQEHVAAFRKSAAVRKQPVS